MRRLAHRSAPLAGLVVALLLAGCAGTSGGGSTGGSGTAGSSDPPQTSTSASGTAPPSGTEAATLVVSYEGGLVPPERQHDIPSLSMWADGRIIQPGAQAAIYPPPALPAVTLAQVEPAAMPGVLDTLSDGLAGLPDDFGYPPTADVPSTVVTWRADGAEQTWTAASLGVGDDTPSDQVTAQQVQAREQLTRVVDYAQAVAAGQVESVPVTQEGAYVPSAWYVWSVPYQPPPDGSEAPQRQRWPGPELTGTADGPWTCQVVTGADAEAVTAALSAAVATTPWRSGGKNWTVVVRPVLPGDPLTCPQ